MTALEEVEALQAVATTPSQRRTVISRAYYVSFRQLVSAATVLGFDQNVQDTGPGRRRSVHRRLFDFLRGCDHPVLQKISRERIQELFDLRVKADYRFLIAVTNAEAKEAVLIAQDIQDWMDEAGLEYAF